VGNIETWMDGDLSFTGLLLVTGCGNGNGVGEGRGGVMCFVTSRGVGGCFRLFLPSFLPSFCFELSAWRVTVWW